MSKSRIIALFIFIFIFVFFIFAWFDKKDEIDIDFEGYETLGELLENTKDPEKRKKIFKELNKFDKLMEEVINKSNN